MSGAIVEIFAGLRVLGSSLSGWRPTSRDAGLDRVQLLDERRRRARFGRGDTGRCTVDTVSGEALQ